MPVQIRMVARAPRSRRGGIKAVGDGGGPGPRRWPGKEEPLLDMSRARVAKAQSEPAMMSRMPKVKRRDCPRPTSSRLCKDW
jgi:hypothetical protein